MSDKKAIPKFQGQKEQKHQIVIDDDIPINRKKKSSQPINDESQKLYHWLPWTQKQRLKFALFVTTLIKQFETTKRKSLSLFKAMAKFIGTRNKDQCRTFTYKMERQFSSVQKIISSIKSKYSNQVFQSELIQNRQKIIALHNQFRNNQDDNHNDLAELKQMAQPYIQRAMRNSKQDFFGSFTEKMKPLFDQHPIMPNQIQSANFKAKQYIKWSKSIERNDNLCEQEGPIISQQRKQLILQCNYHLKQWLKASTQLNAINQSIFRIKRNLF